MKDALRGNPLSWGAISLGLVLTFNGAARASSAESELVSRLPASLSNHASTAPVLDVTNCGEMLIAVGTRGLILLSKDRGQTWEQRPSPIDVTLTSVACRGDGLGFAVGHEETLLKTADAGTTWQLVQTDSKGSPLLRVRFFGSDTGFAVGGLGTLLNTADGGASWTRSIINTDDGFDPHLFDIATLPGNRLLVAAEAGHLFRSSDGGSSWAEITSPYTGSFFGLATFGTDQVIAFGMLGHTFLSGDGGDSWEELSTGESPSLFSSVVTSDRIFLCGADGAVVSATLKRPTDLSQSAMPGRPNIAGLVAIPGGLLLASDRGLTRVSRSLVKNGQ